MKKSTKIILIASGSVILVSIIFIIVFALTIDAQTNPPIPKPSGYKCKTGIETTSANSGMVLNAQFSQPRQIEGNGYTTTMTATFSGASEFIQKARNIGDKQMYYVELHVKKGGDVLYSENVSNNILSPIQKTFNYTINPGETINFQVDSTICWHVGGAGSIDADLAQVNFPNPPITITLARAANGSTPTVTNPTPTPPTGSPGSTSDPSSKDCNDICTNPQNWIAKLLSRIPIVNLASKTNMNYIVCWMECEYVSFIADFYQRAMETMICWSGISDLTIDNSGGKVSCPSPAFLNP